MKKVNPKWVARYIATIALFFGYVKIAGSFFVGHTFEFCASTALLIVWSFLTTNTSSWRSR